MRRGYKVAVAAIAGFTITFGCIVLYWWSGFDSERCSGEECVLEYAAVMTSGMIIGALIGLACGFVVYVLTGT
jgi:hypothetical protein